MASKKAIQRLLISASRPSVQAYPRLSVTSCPFTTTSRLDFLFDPSRRHYQSHRRPYSTSPPSIKSYSYEDILAHTSSPSPHRILVDVREPGELQRTGYIPTAVNLPINSNPDAVFLKPEEFEERFGWEKPGTETEAVFYCLAGVRSRTAARMAREAGWRVGEYVGSWKEWSEKGGAKEDVGKGGGDGATRTGV